MSLVFYGTRTSGAVVSFDQILDFAAIRTNADLEEIDRFEVQSGLLPHVVPSPEVILAAQIAVSRLTDPSLISHYEMVRMIREKLRAWSPSTFVGFNSLALDEHFLRQCLYQMLHHPYLTNCDGNTRADVARVIQVSPFFAPNVLALPRAADGKLNIDLCAVASANGLSYNRTCSAMKAVEAIIYLARQLSQKAPDLWSTAMRFSKKAAVVDFIDSEPVFSFSDFFYGKPYSWLVTLIGSNNENVAERYVFNLGVDPDELIGLTATQLQSRLTEMPKPVRVLRINAAPTLTTETDAPAGASGRKLSTDELERRAEVLRSDKAFRDRLVAAYERIKEPKIPSRHVEEQIYDAFPSDHDLALTERFHSVPWEKRGAIIEQHKDPRLKRLGQRLIHFEKPDALDSSLRLQHDRAVAKRLLGTDGDVPWLTLPRALDEVNRLLSSTRPGDASHLRKYRTHIIGWIKSATANAASPVQRGRA